MFVVHINELADLAHCTSFSITSHCVGHEDGVGTEGGTGGQNCQIVLHFSTRGIHRIGGGDGLLRKVKDLGAKELDDRGKIDLKDLLMFGREKRDPGNSVLWEEMCKKDENSQGPVEKGIGERQTCTRGHIFS